MGLFTIKIPDLDDPDPGTVQGILVFLDIGWQKFTGPGNFSTPWVQSFPKNFQHRFSPPSSNPPSLMEHSERWGMKFDSNQNQVELKGLINFNRDSFCTFITYDICSSV